MYSEEAKSVWVKKGATLSDKSARKEFGLTQEEIIEAINDGKLQYRTNVIFGNPYFKLVRSEVEAFVDLAQVNKELKRLKAQVVSIEQRKVELLASLDE
jgi:hypothetical protein